MHHPRGKLGGLHWHAVKRVRVVHWNEEQGRADAARVRKAGFKTEHEIPRAPNAGTLFMRTMRAAPPDAMIINLDRIVAKGEWVALAMRQNPTTRLVPLAFYGGKPEAIARIRRLLPDVFYFPTLDDLIAELPGITTMKLKEAVKAPSVMAGYSGTPLPKKLGIKEGSTVGLVNAPEDFEKTLGEVPAGVKFTNKASEKSDVIVWFVESQKQFLARLEAMAGMNRGNILWVAWPKKASGIKSDLTETVIRDKTLPHGIVDVKVAAIDATWSGLMFRRRRTPRLKPR